jgi:predicted RNase H-like HicB family nuclease
VWRVESGVNSTPPSTLSFYTFPFVVYWLYGGYMELEYTYFEAEDGFFVGWFDAFPEDVTQGESLEELEEMLADMYKCLNLAKYHKRKLVLA